MSATRFAKNDAVANGIDYIGAFFIFDSSVSFFISLPSSLPLFLALF